MGISKGRTPGHPNTAWGVKVYYKPSMGKVIARIPGVLRRSDRVLERNRAFAAKKPASACKGKPWRQFVSCLSQAAR